MRLELTDLITRPEPSARPALTLLLAFAAVASLAAALALLVGRL